MPTGSSKSVVSVIRVISWFLMPQNNFTQGWGGQESSTWEATAIVMSNTHDVAIKLSSK